MRIDSHQHYWKANRGDYHWMSANVSMLCRDYLPIDLQPSLLRHKIDKTILVQAAQTVAETQFLLELAEGETSVAGVVGWLDMESSNFPAQLEQFRKHPKFIGLRPMLQDLPEDDWIVRPQVLASLKLVEQLDFPFEFLTFSRHLPYVLRALKSVPKLRAVIDHISKPEISTGKMEPWRGLMAQLAENSNLYCKLSGMATEANHADWSANDLRPYVEHVLDHFGWDRVMYGSDWPVCLLAGSYDQVIDAIRAILSTKLDEDAEHKLFGENAIRFYKLNSQAK